MRSTLPTRDFWGSPLTALPLAGSDDAVAVVAKHTVSTVALPTGERRLIAKFGEQFKPETHARDATIVAVDGEPVVVVVAGDGTLYTVHLDGAVGRLRLTALQPHDKPKTVAAVGNMLYVMTWPFSYLYRVVPEANRHYHRIKWVEPVGALLHAEARLMMTLPRTLGGGISVVGHRKGVVRWTKEYETGWTRNAVLWRKYLAVMARPGEVICVDLRDGRVASFEVAGRGQPALLVAVADRLYAVQAKGGRGPASVIQLEAPGLGDRPPWFRWSRAQWAWLQPAERRTLRALLLVVCRLAGLDGKPLQALPAELWHLVVALFVCSTLPNMDSPTDRTVTLAIEALDGTDYSVQLPRTSVNLRQAVDQAYPGLGGQFRLWDDDSEVEAIPSADHRLFGEDVTLILEYIGTPYEVYEFLPPPLVEPGGRQALLTVDPQRVTVHGQRLGFGGVDPLHVEEVAVRDDDGRCRHVQVVSLKHAKRSSLQIVGGRVFYGVARLVTEIDGEYVSATVEDLLAVTQPDPAEPPRKRVRDIPCKG